MKKLCAALFVMLLGQPFPAFAQSARRASPDTLPPLIRLDTADRTMSATYSSPAGIAPSGVRFVFDGVDKTADCIITPTGMRYKLPADMSLFRSNSVRLEVRDLAGVLGVAAVGATFFMNNAPGSGQADHTSVSYNLLQREQVCVHICHWGTETPTRILEMTQGPGVGTADWDGREANFGGAGLPDTYTFYVYVRRASRWIRIAAIDPVRLAPKIRPGVVRSAAGFFPMDMLPQNQDCRTMLFKPIPAAAEDQRLWWAFAPPRPEQGDVGDPQLTLGGKPLLTFRASSVMVNAHWRAAQTRNRFLFLAYAKYPPSRITLAQRGGFWKVLAGLVAVDLVTEEDARHAGVTAEVLANQRRTAVQQILSVLETPKPKSVSR